MGAKYPCMRCGKKLDVRQLVKSGATHCACGKALSQKRVMQLYRGQARTFVLECLCGKTYKIVPPSGEYTFICKRCGRYLLSIRPRKINGTDLPRYIAATSEKNWTAEETAATR